MIDKTELTRSLKSHFEQFRSYPTNSIHQVHTRAFDWNLLNWNDVGQLYERYCLLKIADDFEDPFILVGPNFLNFAVNTHVRSRGNEIAVPDIVVLNMQSGTLRALYEIKSGSALQAQPKVKGFSKLLEYCRADSNSIFQRIMQSLPQLQLAVFPQQYAVPPNREIDVVFVSPGNNFVSPDDRQGFPISHRHLGLF